MPKINIFINKLSIARRVGVLFVSLVIAFVVFMGITIVYAAWNEPTANPPGNNVESPINISGTAQTKAGNLTIGGTNWAQIQFFPSVGDTYNPLTGGSNRAHFHFGFPNTPSGKEPLLEIPADLWIIGGTHNLKVDGSAAISGNVGIGTTGPNGQLDIAKNPGNGYLDGIVIGQVSGDNTETIQTYIDTGAGGGWGNWSYAGGCCHPLLIQPYGGNVGIGTTNPYGKLHISGGHLNLGGTADPSGDQGNNWITWGYRADNNPYYAIRTQYKTYGSFTYSRLQLNWHTGIEIGANQAYGGVRFFNEAPGIGGSQIMSVGDGDANVRVTNNLYVAGTARMTGFQLGTSATAGHVLTTNASGVGTWQAVPSAPVTSVFGRTGAITAQAGDYSTHYLSRAVDTWITSSDGHARFYFANTSHTYLRSASNMYFRTGGDNTRMTILSDGRVGIGTTDPGAKLDVQGNILIGANNAQYLIQSPGQLVIQSTDSDGSYTNLYLKPGTTANSFVKVSSDDGFYVSNRADTATNAFISGVGSKNSYLARQGGNVGIGKTDPWDWTEWGTSDLDVNGAVRAGKFYDDDLNYYMDFNTSSVINSLTADNISLYESGSGCGATNRYIDFNRGGSAIYDNCEMTFQTDNIWRWYSTWGGHNEMELRDNGNLYIRGSYYCNQSVDVAEMIYSNKKSGLEAGDVVVVDPDNDETVISSSKPYDPTVAGIISTEPGLVLGSGFEGDTAKGDVELSLVGRVPCKVTTENGSIKRGDLLVTSSKPGYAMKGDIEEIKEMPGVVLGKALEELKEGEGKILVLISLR